MIALLVVGCVLGYLLLGLITSVVVSAKAGEVDGIILGLCLLFWPVALAGAMLIAFFYFPVVGVVVAWNWSVRKLNPDFKGWVEL